MSRGAHLRPHIQPRLCARHKPHFTRCEHFFTKQDTKQLEQKNGSSKTGRDAWKHFTPEWNPTFSSDGFLQSAHAGTRSLSAVIRVRRGEKNTNSTRARGKITNIIINSRLIQIPTTSNISVYVSICGLCWAGARCPTSPPHAAVCGLPSSSAGFQQKLKVLHEPSLPFPTKRPTRMQQDAPKPKQMLNA